MKFQAFHWEIGNGTLKVAVAVGGKKKMNVYQLKNWGLAVMAIGTNRSVLGREDGGLSDRPGGRGALAPGSTGVTSVGVTI